MNTILDCEAKKKNDTSVMCKWSASDVIWNICHFIQMCICGQQDSGDMKWRSLLPPEPKLSVKIKSLVCLYVRPTVKTPGNMCGYWYLTVAES